MLSIENKATVSVEELNQILMQLPEREGVVEFEFGDSVKMIDIVFFGGLFLLNRMYGTRFIMNKSNVALGSESFEISHYLEQLKYLYYQNSNPEATFDFIEIPGIKPSQLVTSSSFAPILYIDDTSINQIFSKESSGNPFGALKKKYYEALMKPRNLAEKAYLESRNVAQYYENAAPIHIFIFKILFDKISPFVNSKGKNIQHPEERTEELWKFTFDYVYGLHELAKNIVEHSTSKRGIITVRAYESPKKKGVASESDNLQVPLEESDSELFLQTHVFDYGKTGIIPTLAESTPRLAQETPGLEEFLKNDIETLAADYRLKDFIDPTSQGKPRLEHQTYRYMAHYGLMMFYELIRNNDGSILCESLQSDGKKDRYVSNGSRASLQGRESIASGTSYYFELPFQPHLFRSTPLRDVLPAQRQSTKQNIEAIAKFYSHKPQIFDLDMREAIQAVSDRQTEGRLYEYVRTKLSTDEFKAGQYSYVTINMDGVTLSASSLLRFLSYITEAIQQTPSLIVYNITSALCALMINNNETYFNYLKEKLGLAEIPYWFKGKGLLVYNYIRNSTDTDQFYFADLLCGKSEAEFNAVNRIIHDTYPNARTIILNSKFEPKQTLDLKEIPFYLEPFFIHNFLQPFDLLLHALRKEPGQQSEESLFLNNLRIVVNQDITCTQN